MDFRGFKSLSLSICLVALGSCAPTNFNGASPKKQPGIARDENALPDPANPAGPNSDKPNLGFGEGGNACSKSGPARAINLSIGVHQDSSAQATNRYKGGVPATADIAESAVATFNVNDIAGNLLPVSNFKLDDMAIIVPASTPLGSVLSCGGGGCTGSRTITVPPTSLLVYDAADPSFAAGALDSDASTTYVFGAKRVDLPGNQDRKRSEVAALGIPGIAHNKITLKELKTRGFTDAQGNIAFKVLLVPHGSGYVNFVIQVTPCK